MYKYKDKVQVQCLVCKAFHINEIRYGANEKYPDDFEIQCKHCGIWEEGSMPMQNFEQHHFYGRFFEENKFYQVIANFDMSSWSEIRVKAFKNLDQALIEAAYQVNDFLDCLCGNDALDKEDSDWEETLLEEFRFYGVSKSGEDFATITVEEANFEDEGMNR